MKRPKENFSFPFHFRPFEFSVFSFPQKKRESKRKQTRSFQLTLYLYTLLLSVCAFSLVQSVLHGILHYVVCFHFLNVHFLVSTYGTYNKSHSSPRYSWE